jgi:hypothetical protein
MAHTHSPSTVHGPTIAYQCDTCPFTTSDVDAMRGHETYLNTHPRGWLGHGEVHTMHVWRDGDPRMAWTPPRWSAR